MRLEFRTGRGDLELDGPVPVGAAHHRPQPRQDRQRPRMRVPVAVVPTDRDHRQPGTDGGQKGRVGGTGTVVGHLEEAGPELPGAREQVLLGGALDVTGEQRHPRAPAHPQHQ